MIVAAARAARAAPSATHALRATTQPSGSRFLSFHAGPSRPAQSARPSVASLLHAPSLRLQRHSGPYSSSSAFHSSASSRVASPAAATTVGDGAAAASTSTEFASQVGGSASWFAGIPQIDACFESMRPIVHSLPDYFGQTGPHKYAVSIVLLALLVRMTVALPLAVWSRRRAQRMTEVVLPTWRRVAPQLAEAVGRRFRRAGKSHEEYAAALPAQAEAVRKALIRKHRCHPYKTIATTIAVNMPVFLFVAGSLRYGLLPPSPMIEEVIPWWSPSPELLRAFESDKQLLLARGLEPEALAQLTAPIGPSLAASDKQIWAPLALGMLYLGNTELLAWKRRQDTDDGVGAGKRAQPAESPAPAESEADPAAKQRAAAAAAAPALSSRMDNLYRLLVMLMVPVATTLPSGVLIYWLASGAWNLANTVVTTLLDRRRKKVERVDEEFVRRVLSVDGGAGGGAGPGPGARGPIRNSRRRFE